MASVKRLGTHCGGQFDRRQMRSLAQATMARWLSPEARRLRWVALAPAQWPSRGGGGEPPYAFRNSRML